MEPYYLTLCLALGIAIADPRHRAALVAACRPKDEQLRKLIDAIAANDSKALCSVALPAFTKVAKGDTIASLIVREAVRDLDGLAIAATAIQAIKGLSSLPRLDAAARLDDLAKQLRGAPKPAPPTNGKLVTK